MKPNGGRSVWYDWYEDVPPCFFTRARTLENAAFLKELFPADLFIPVPESRENPLLKSWHSPAPSEFLQLNALAEDLRLLARKPGIDGILQDLSTGASCNSTWHTVHSAGLFERAKPGTILEFVQGGESEIPDFIVDFQGRRIPVEAKLLMDSEDQARFTETAQRIEAACIGDGGCFPVQTGVLVARNG
jgi:hypothetical protein